MIRIGIIGTENSHAMAFSQLLNTKDPKDSLDAGARIVAVHANETETAQKIIDEVDSSIELILNPDDFFGKVDAMMITCRRGSEHYAYAKPFIEKGMPVFVDKPFTASVEDAREMVALAERTGAPLCGGSSLRHCADVLDMRREVAELRAKNALLSAAVQYPADVSSIYNGFYFYSPHLVETVLTAFGPDIRKVSAFQNDKGVLAVARYDDVDISMHFTTGSHGYSGTIYGIETNTYRQFNIGNVYADEVKEFLAMCRSGKSPTPFSDLVLPVLVIDAIITAYESGAAVEICP